MSDDRYKSSDYIRYPELPPKMIIEPVPQSSRQSIEDYLCYYDTIISANLWDDVMAAVYLPQFITDPRLRQMINDISLEQRKSYRWLRRTLLDAAKYQQNGNNKCLYQKYWTKISDLRSHLCKDLLQFRREIHGLAEETCQHIATQYVVPTDQLIKNVVPKVTRTVGGVLNTIATVAAGRPRSYEEQESPPPYQDIYGDGKF